MQTHRIMCSPCCVLQVFTFLTTIGQTNSYRLDKGTLSLISLFGKIGIQRECSILFIGVLLKIFSRIPLLYYLLFVFGSLQGHILFCSVCLNSQGLMNIINQILKKIILLGLVPMGVLCSLVNYLFLSVHSGFMVTNLFTHSYQWVLFLETQVID